MKSNWLSNDGDDEGISIDDDGKITTSNKLTLGGNLKLNTNWLSNDGGNEGISISNDGSTTTSSKLTLGGNVLLNDNWISNDGGNEGISISNAGAITTSDELTLGGNVKLNSNWLSNDGNNEGISIDNDGKITTSDQLTLGGNISLKGNWLSRDGDDEGITVSYSGRVTISSAQASSSDYPLTIENTADDNSNRNDGLLIIAGHSSDNNKNNRFISFETPDGTNCGRITQDGAGVVNYTTTSDIRLKENIQPTTYGIEDILKINVRDYNYKKDKAENKKTGFIAQQLHTVFPTAVFEGGKNEKTNPWTVDYASLTPLLVKGIQEQQAMIDSLKEEKTEQQTEINQLKEQVQLLEAQNQKISHLETMLLKMQAQLGLTNK